MNNYSLEFDDFEEQFEEWLGRVINDGAVVVITAESVPLAAIVPLAPWERFRK